MRTRRRLVQSAISGQPKGTVDVVLPVAPGTLRMAEEEGMESLGKRRYLRRRQCQLYPYVL